MGLLFGRWLLKSSPRGLAVALFDRLGCVRITHTTYQADRKREDSSTVGLQKLRIEEQLQLAWLVRVLLRKARWPTGVGQGADRSLPEVAVT